VTTCAEATREPAVWAVARFLATLDVAALDLPEDFDPSANLTFEVEGAGGAWVRPIDLPTVRAFWAAHAAPTGEKTRPEPEEGGEADETAVHEVETDASERVESEHGDDSRVMQCLVCGESRPPVKRLPISIKGIPGGQSSGMALISANEDAFTSYGLEASLIAPTCEECGQCFGNALNHLLRDKATHLIVGPVVYIFWAREQAPFSLATLLSEAKPEDVKLFLAAPWKGKAGAADLEATAFYAATLSASGARVVVRDWIETTLGEAQEHLRRYFALQRLIGFDGEPHWVSLRRLAYATINSKSKEAEPAAQVGQALLRVALHGGPLPDWLLYQAVRRIRAEQHVTPAHAALIKMVLVSGHRHVEGDDDMAELDLTNRDQAYLCGRLLAELEAVQRAALGDVNATIVDRYYGTASSAPASVFGRLLRGAQPHLAKLRRDREGTYVALDRRLQEILEGLPAFPHTLTLQKQGLFALGFYHQKAADSRAIKARQAEKAAVAATALTSEVG
nr:type I-C CRISPR-associated protein Cas8c/Csd1 [Ktedonobacterales bacterium]